MNINKQISNSISRLRFILILSIVLSHACSHVVSSPYIIWDNIGIYNLMKLLSNFGGFIGTSVFFFISGYLFYKDDFDIRIYIENIKKRLKTLLVPYLFWNSVVICFYIIIENVQLFKSFMPNRNFVSDSSFIEFLDFYYHPIANQFWFVKDLLIVCLFSIIIYYILNWFNKIWGGILIIILFVLWGGGKY